MANKILSGHVIRDSNDKTIVVSVETRKLNPVYGKYVRRSRKYHVHDEENKCKVGDVVRFISARPYSKMKKWKTIEE